MRAADVLAEFMVLMERAKGSGGLGVNVMLGFPGTGRTGPALPCASLAFATEDYANHRPLPRLGQVPPAGRTIVATLYLFANNEPELLALVDALGDVKDTVASVSVNDLSLVVRYGPTQRVEMVLTDTAMEYATACTINFSRQ